MDTSIASVVTVCEAFEQCDFPKFWSLYTTLPTNVTDIKGLTTRLRSRIHQILSLSYRSCPTPIYTSLMGTSTSSEFIGDGSKVEGGEVVFDGNEFNQVKKKEYGDTINIESLKRVLNY
ncbi:hypothetical protein TrCOL_g9424 [Triparma columacea]|uniref:Uncharacterized protein n=1 Tax=Triparma columacea TaxID=722753 RepID=A0A9W7GP40_9STRA|nr:hypothetical protein TrCOL_g9424 [Triparma columacea]